MRWIWIVIVSAVALLQGCSAKVLPYKAAAFEPYRAWSPGEVLDVAVDEERPIQRIVQDGVWYHGIPITLEIGADAGINWAHLDGAIGLHEIRGGRRVVTHQTVLLPYVLDGDGKLEKYREALSSEGMGEAREQARELLAEKGDREGRDVFILVCREQPSSAPCAAYGRRYELSVDIQPEPDEGSDLQSAEDLWESRVPSATYPFVIERKSYPVTILVGSAVLVLFLGASAG